LIGPHWNISRFLITDLGKQSSYIAFLASGGRSYPTAKLAVEKFAATPKNISTFVLKAKETKKRHLKLQPK
jgi:hypothetical protein